jgi:hypothetical protein
MNEPLYNVHPTEDELDLLPTPSIPAAVWDALKEYEEEAERLTGSRFHD